MRSQVGLAALLAIALVTAGCAGVQPDGGTATDTATGTATPTDTATPTATATATPANVDFPDGPREPPARPATLSASSVREYVETYEYRYAYNSLWINEYSEVTLDCRVDNVTQRSSGYEAVVTCTGYSNTNVPENSTLTPGPHADWFTQSYRYRVTETATRRQRVENRDPVS
ncbi:hypothetical protein [Haloplanus halobius]|uniref:hypothetical protein n=1 Tax=Haloplanus halobius TaxID=2934938 RepID=UPI00200BC474|nr:hypothetical protein [Haloplanus sp. XH21]